jgi:hypothetical protein
MKLRLIAAAVVVLLEGIAPRMASATEPWLSLSEGAIEGVWESVDYESLRVFRLEVTGKKAVLAVTAGAKQGEYLFRSDNVVARTGKVSFVATTAGGLSLRVTGEGNALGSQGRMTLRMANVSRERTSWANTERLFVKGPAKPRLEDLIETDGRAQSLIEGTAQPCCAGVLLKDVPKDSESQSGKKTQ